MIKLLGAGHPARPQAAGPVKLRLRQHQGRLALFPGGDPRPHQRDLVVDVLDGMEQLEARRPRLGQ
ncbi:MAG: hypothetical protein JO015_11970 [Verrucomicrobia bacterium]|nr:hypothetical protein [Verrucomicrobiota bacterium]